MREYLLIALVAAAVTYLLVPLVRVFAIRIGAMPEVRERDVHTTPTPRLGGLAMYGGLVAGLLFATQLDWVGARLTDPNLAGGQTVIALIAAGGLITVTGFLDDWWGMDPFIKLGGQIAAAGLMVAFGLNLSWIPVPGSGSIGLDGNLRAVITILIVVVAINAVNFVDGLDGLAAGIVCIAAMSTWAYSVALSTIMGDTRINATAAITSILIGMCLGFLPHNFHPAKIFMGDTGAMLIGLVLASSVITVTPIDPTALSPTINRFPVVLPLLLPVAVMVLPLLDLVTAVVRRTSYGKSPFAPDRGHLHHRLLDIGHSHRRTVLIMYAWTFLFGFTIVGLSLGGVPVVVFLATVALALGVLVLMAMPRWRARRTSGGGAHAAGRHRSSAPAPEPVSVEARQATQATQAAQITEAPGAFGGEPQAAAPVPPAWPDSRASAPHHDPRPSGLGPGDGHGADGFSGHRADASRGHRPGGHRADGSSGLRSDGLRSDGHRSDPSPAVPGWPGTSAAQSPAGASGSTGSMFQPAAPAPAPSWPDLSVAQPPAAPAPGARRADPPAAPGWPDPDPAASEARFAESGTPAAGPAFRPSETESGQVTPGSRSAESPEDTAVIPGLGGAAPGLPRRVTR